MIATSVIDNRLNDLLATDTVTLDTAGGPHVHLITSAFTPGLDTDFTTLTEASFTGGAAKTATLGAQQAFFDPISGQHVCQLNEPLGGWQWVCTVAPSPAQVVRGYVLTDTANAVTFGSALFPTPVTIQNVGDAVSIGEVRFNIPVGMIN